MNARDGVRGISAGLVAGIASGLFGVGGGLAMVPMLTGFFRLTQHQAHGTSLAVIGFTALAALAVYGAHANVVWLVAAPMAIGSLAGAPLGARLTTRMSPRGLKRAFALFLAVVAIRLLWAPPVVSEQALVGGGAGFVAALGLGFAAGVLAGFMGVGGGIVAVPALTLAFGLSQHAAQGTSLAVMLVTAPAATFEHARQRNVIWRLVPAFAIGTVVSAPLAAWAVQHLPHALLTRAFAVFLLVTAAHTWARAGRSPAQAGANVPPR